MTLHSSSTGALLLLAAVACGSDSGATPTTTATQIAIQSGNNQIAAAGTALAPLQVLVRDAADAPVPVKTSTTARLSIKTRMTQSELVCGMVRGSDPVLRDEWIVVGAHYDHVGTGASGSLDPRTQGVPSTKGSL